MSNHVNSDGVVYCENKQETDISDMTKAAPLTFIFETGFGANDRREATHIVRVEAPEVVWNERTDHIEDLR